MGYKQGAVNGYRSKIAIGLTAGILLAITLVLLIHLQKHSNEHGLPYKDSFAMGQADEWTALGGTWKIAANSIRNASDDRGAKFLTGSYDWENYSIEADIMLTGTYGDAGLMIRTSNEEEGVDAYDGYYAGIRSHGDALLLGRADFRWTAESQDLTHTLGEVHSRTWYHLKLLAVGCYVVTEARLAGQSDADATALAVVDHNCIRSGRAGLRSYFAGGAWRNVHVRKAGKEELAAMLGRTYSHKLSDLSAPNADNPHRPEDISSGQHDEDKAATPHSSVERIGDLRLASSSKHIPVTLRGIVTLTSPSVFIQDSSGGIALSGISTDRLNMGDEVEVSGLVEPGQFSSTLQNPTIRVLWARTPQPALSITATQAATGAFDATYIEIETSLRKKVDRSDGSVLLDLESGSEAFEAIIDHAHGEKALNDLKTGSMLRLRGVCVVSPAYTNNLVPFVVLVPSLAAVRVVAGPPWWSTDHLVLLGLTLVLIAVGLNLLYGRAIRWRLRAVFDERERLAQEMHDTLAQGFAGIGFQLEAIRSGVPEKSTKIHEQLDFATSLVRHSHEEARRSITALRPQALEEGNLAAALEACARRLVEGSKVEVHSLCVGDIRSMPLRITDTLFRIGQEALANAVSHAAASKISICLKYEEKSIELSIADDGHGFLPSTSFRGFGIEGMKNRADSISGTITVESDRGCGTVVDVRVPLPRQLTPWDWPRVIFTLLRGRKPYDPTSY